MESVRHTVRVVGKYSWKLIKLGRLVLESYKVEISILSWKEPFEVGKTVVS